MLPHRRRWRMEGKMAGCYGNTVEDLHFERQLIDYLDEQYAAMDAQKLRIAQLWEDATTEAESQCLVDDWEVLLQQLPSVIRLIAEAKEQASPWQPERKDRMAALGEDLVLLLGDELERVAHHMGER